MALVRCHPILLFVVWLNVVAAQVEPPTNVTLHCRNLHNVLEWSYNQLSPGLRFRVDYSSVTMAPNEVWVDAPTLQADVSFLSDINDEYYLTVTAVIGQNQSDAAPADGIIFSYFKDTLANQKCFVDFPSVNVTALEDDIVLFHFTHPWLLYNRKLSGSPNPKTRNKKSHDVQNIRKIPVFNYDVIIINQEAGHHTFDCMERVCEEKLPVPAAQEKHCLKVMGELLKMSVLATQEYCALPSTPHEWSNNYYIMMLIIACVLVVFAVAFILFMVYRKNTNPSSSFPNSMLFTSGLKRFTFGVIHETVAVPELGATSPSPLLTTEENEFTSSPSTTDPELRLPNRGLSTEDTDVCDDREVENNEGPGYMPGSNLDEDETLCYSNPSSGYKKRELLVKLAPDEQANGYRGKDGTDVL